MKLPLCHFTFGWTFMIIVVGSACSHDANNSGTTVEASRLTELRQLFDAAPGRGYDFGGVKERAAG